jgi:hypothetical protein
MSDDYLRISKHQGNSHLEDLVLQDTDGIALSDFVYTVATDKGRKASLTTLFSALQLQLTWFIPMSGVTDAEFIVTGELREVANTQSANYVTEFSAGNQHIYIYVDAVTTGGVITITGTSVSESTAVPVASDTEVITIDTTADQYYQSSKKWYDVQSIVIDGGDITGLDYDIGVVGYLDMGNRDFEILGYRAEFRSVLNTADIGIHIEKIQDDGSGKMSIVPMEDIGIDSSVGDGDITDGLRTGGDDRSLNFDATAFAANTNFCFKHTDFSTYFSNDENILEGSSKDEGIIVHFTGSPSGGIGGVDHGTVTIFYKLL